VQITTVHPNVFNWYGQVFVRLPCSAGDIALPMGRAPVALPFKTGREI